ncbi:MAG: type II toxin-antitoxin system HicB family antitoxin [Selenomonadaceae bacterium]|nr:type II toxin-antitoxin system HicB family antitoxin [Selenomonadaceae bacterium]
MIFTYPALVHNDSDGLWLEFPDLPGCQTCSPSLKELIIDAEEALECYIEEELEHSGVLPKPSDIKSINVTNDDFTTLIAIEIDLKKSKKSIRKTLTIPYWLNEKATAAGINFSKTLQEALLAKLAY